MKTFIALAAFAAVLSTSPSHGLQDKVAVSVPATAQTRQAADLITRAKSAFLDYASASSVGDLPGIERTLTSDAVIEYATEKPGVYLTVDTTGLTAHWRGDPAAIGPGQQVSNVWIFPTADQKTVFVRYDTSSGSATPGHHLALLEMSGDRISRIRDFTHPEAIP